MPRSSPRSGALRREVVLYPWAFDLGWPRVHFPLKKLLSNAVAPLLATFYLSFDIFFMGLFSLGLWHTYVLLRRTFCTYICWRAKWTFGKVRASAINRWARTPLSGWWRDSRLRKNRLRQDSFNEDVPASQMRNSENSIHARKWASRETKNQEGSSKSEWW
jgi:hypothetical protein